MKRFFLTYILLLLPLLSYGQTRTRVFGKVVDENGQPIELATVQVKSQNVLTLTNLKGEYSLH